MEEDAMNYYCDIYHLKNLIKEPTCFKSAQNPTTIDMILTNKSAHFQNSICIETGISDHHKMVIIALKVHFKKFNHTKIKLKNYNKNFNLYSFKEDLKTSLLFTDQGNLKYDELKEIFLKILNKYAPMKEKLVRGNNSPFMNETLAKAFMHRAKLKNKYNKNSTEQNYLCYKIQRNYCVNLLKGRKNTITETWT